MYITYGNHCSIPRVTPSILNTHEYDIITHFVEKYGMYSCVLYRKKSHYIIS